MFLCPPRDIGACVPRWIQVRIGRVLSKLHLVLFHTPFEEVWGLLCLGVRVLNLEVVGMSPSPARFDLNSAMEVMKRGIC